MRRLHTAAALLMTLAVAVPAAGQGRIMGVVVDGTGRPVKGATIRAINADSAPREWTSTSDDKGRFVILGLRISPNWTFVAEAPGFVATGGSAPVRSTFGTPLRFVLRPDPGPPPGALVKNIQELVASANALRDEGRLDQALAAYQAIQARNPTLTAINLVIADVYRRQAEQERDEPAKRALLDRAAAAELAATDVSPDSK